jgi:hypothetical protein
MSREIYRCGGRAPVARTVRFNGFIACLCLASGALALPLSAEEVTVTVPPGPAAQETQAPAPAALPSFTGGDKLKTPAATSATADQGTAGTPPTSSAVVKHKSKDKKPATADAKTKSAPQATADNTTAAAPAAAAPTATAPADGTTKPVDKTKQAAKPSPCKGLDEATCGGNKLCSWVAPKSTTPDASGKVPQAQCRSLAALKKEAAKKAAKAAKPETLPWAANAASGAPAAAGAGASATSTSSAPTGDATTKPATVKKTKTASVKKTPAAPKPQTEVAPPIPTESGSTQEAPSAAAPAGPDPQ